MKKIKEFFVLIGVIISYVWDMFTILKARAKSEKLLEKYEAPPSASDHP